MPAQEAKGAAVARLAVLMQSAWLKKHGIVVPPPELNAQQRAEIEECFNALDTDGSGAIDADEIVHAFGELGFELSKDAIDELLSEAVTDGSGELQFEEFMSLMGRALYRPQECSKELVANTGAGLSLSFPDVVRAFRRKKLIESLMRGGDARRKVVKFHERVQALTNAEKEELRQRAAKQHILQRMETARSEAARLARMRDPLASHRAGRVKSRLQDVIGRSLGTFDSIMATQHPSLAALERLRSARSALASARSGYSSVIGGGAGGGEGGGSSSRSSSYSDMGGLGVGEEEEEDEDYRGGVRSEGEAAGVEAWRVHLAAAALQHSALHPALRSSRALLASTSGSTADKRQQGEAAAAAVTGTSAGAGAYAAAGATSHAATATAAKTAQGARFNDVPEDDEDDEPVQGAAPAPAVAAAAASGGLALKATRGVSFRAVSFRGLAPDSSDDDDEDEDEGGGGDRHDKDKARAGAEDEDDGDPLGLERKRVGKRASGDRRSDEGAQEGEDSEEEAQPQPGGVFLTEANVKAHTRSLQQGRSATSSTAGGGASGLRAGSSKRSMGREVSGASRAGPPGTESSALSGMPLASASAAALGSERRRLAPPPVQPLPLPPYGTAAPPPGLNRSLSMSSMDSTVVKFTRRVSRAVIKFFQQLEAAAKVMDHKFDNAARLNASAVAPPPDRSQFRQVTAPQRPGSRVAQHVAGLGGVSSSLSVGMGGRASPAPSAGNSASGGLEGARAPAGGGRAGGSGGSSYGNLEVVRSAYSSTAACGAAGMRAVTPVPAPAVAAGGRSVSPGGAHAGGLKSGAASSMSVGGVGGPKAGGLVQHPRAWGVRSPSPSPASPAPGQARGGGGFGAEAVRPSNPSASSVAGASAQKQQQQHRPGIPQMTGPPAATAASAHGGRSSPGGSSRAPSRQEYVPYEHAVVEGQDRRHLLFHRNVGGSNSNGNSASGEAIAAVAVAGAAAAAAAMAGYRRHSVDIPGGSFRGLQSQQQPRQHPLVAAATAAMDAARRHSFDASSGGSTKPVLHPYRGGSPQMWAQPSYSTSSLFLPAAVAAPGAGGGGSSSQQQAPTQQPLLVHTAATQSGGQGAGGAWRASAGPGIGSSSAAGGGGGCSKPPVPLAPAGGGPLMPSMAWGSQRWQRSPNGSLPGTASGEFPAPRLPAANSWSRGASRSSCSSSNDGGSSSCGAYGPALSANPGAAAAPPPPAPRHRLSGTAMGPVSAIAGGSGSGSGSSSELRAVAAQAPALAPALAPLRAGSGGSNSSTWVVLPGAGGRSVSTTGAPDTAAPGAISGGFGYEGNGDGGGAPMPDPRGVWADLQPDAPPAGSAEAADDFVVGGVPFAGASLEEQQQQQQENDLGAAAVAARPASRWEGSRSMRREGLEGVATAGTGLLLPAWASGSEASAPPTTRTEGSQMSGTAEASTADGDGGGGFDAEGPLLASIAEVEADAALQQQAAQPPGSNSTTALAAAALAASAAAERSLAAARAGRVTPPPRVLVSDQVLQLPSALHVVASRSPAAAAAAYNNGGGAPGAAALPRSSSPSRGGVGGGGLPMRQQQALAASRRSPAPSPQGGGSGGGGGGGAAAPASSPWRPPASPTHSSPALSSSSPGQLLALQLQQQSRHQLRPESPPRSPAVAAEGSTLLLPPGPPSRARVPHGTQSQHLLHNATAADGVADATADWSDIGDGTARTYGSGSSRSASVAVDGSAGGSSLPPSSRTDGGDGGDAAAAVTAAQLLKAESRRLPRPASPPHAPATDAADGFPGHELPLLPAPSSSGSSYSVLFGSHRQAAVAAIAGATAVPPWAASAAAARPLGGAATAAAVAGPRTTTGSGSGARAGAGSSSGAANATATTTPSPVPALPNRCASPAGSYAPKGAYNSMAVAASTSINGSSSSPGQQHHQLHPTALHSHTGNPQLQPHSVYQAAAVAAEPSSSCSGGLSTHTLQAEASLPPGAGGGDVSRVVVTLYGQPLSLAGGGAVVVQPQLHQGHPGLGHGSHSSAQLQPSQHSQLQPPQVHSEQQQLLLLQPSCSQIHLHSDPAGILPSPAAGVASSPGARRSPTSPAPWQQQHARSAHEARQLQPSPPPATNAPSTSEGTCSSRSMERRGSDTRAQPVAPPAVSSGHSGEATDAAAAAAASDGLPHLPALPEHHHPHPQAHSHQPPQQQPGGAHLPPAPHLAPRAPPPAHPQPLHPHPPHATATAHASPAAAATASAGAQPHSTSPHPPPVPPHPHHPPHQPAAHLQPASQQHPQPHTHHGVTPAADGVRVSLSSLDAAARVGAAAAGMAGHLAPLPAHSLPHPPPPPPHAHAHMHGGGIGTAAGAAVAAAAAAAGRPYQAYAELLTLKPGAASGGDGSASQSQQQQQQYHHHHHPQVPAQAAAHHPAPRRRSSGDTAGSNGAGAGAGPFAAAGAVAAAAADAVGAHSTATRRHEAGGHGAGSKPAAASRHGSAGTSSNGAAQAGGAAAPADDAAAGHGRRSSASRPAALEVENVSVGVLGPWEGSPHGAGEAAGGLATGGQASPLLQAAAAAGTTMF